MNRTTPQRGVTLLSGAWAGRLLLSAAGLLFFLLGDVQAAEQVHWYDIVEGATSGIFTELEEPAGVGNDWWVGRAARAQILGMTYWWPLPDFDEHPWIRLGDLVTDTTQEVYVAKFVGGVTRWMSLGGGTTINLDYDPDHYAFSVQIAEASCHQWIDVPLPTGFAIQNLQFMTMGISIPVRCATLQTTDGKNYTRLYVYQPYCWFDETMRAAGSVKIMAATP